MARGDDWLDQQSIDSFVLPGGLQTKGREIDFRVPLREERVVSLERASELRREVNSGAPGAAPKAISELSPTQPRASINPHPSPGGHRLRNAPNTATAAGVAPGMRNAWPSVSGLT
jgi:hypothetical protein